MFSDALEIHVLELPKLRKQPLKLNALECWLLYLDNMEGEIMEQIANQEPMIQRAMTIEEAFMKSESDRYLYELREKGRHDYYNAISTAEKRGEAKGEARGEARGEPRGEARGEARGKAEGKAEMARNLLANGISPDIIAKSAGLSVEQVRNMM